MKMQDVIIESARAIGIHYLKPEQMKAMYSIIGGRTHLCHCQPAMESQ